MRTVQRYVSTERKPFCAILPATKMVTVLIFALFGPQPLGGSSKRATMGCLLRVWGLETALRVARRPELGRRRAFLGCVRSVPRCRHIRNVPNCWRGCLPWQAPPPDVGSLRCRLLVGAQLVRLESERIDECVGGRLDGCRLRIVDVILGVYGQVLLDGIVDQVEVLSHASGR